MLWGTPFQKELNQIGADARVIMPFHSQMKGKLWRTDKTSGRFQHQF